MSAAASARFISSRRFCNAALSSPAMPRAEASMLCTCLPFLFFRPNVLSTLAFMPAPPCALCHAGLPFGGISAGRLGEDRPAFLTAVSVAARTKAALQTSRCAPQSRNSRERLCHAANSSNVAMEASAAELLEHLAREDVATPAWVLQRLQREIAGSTAALDVAAFLDAKAAGHNVIDVRSPCEFAHGHIPGAVNLPLFTDEERALVGTCYHQHGRDEAMALGLSLVKPKLPRLVAGARELLHSSDPAAGPSVLVHCWRGGLRSGAVAWLLRANGVEAATLSGGYKAFRGWVCAYWGDVEMPPRHVRTRERGVPRYARSTTLTFHRDLVSNHQPKICLSQREQEPRTRQPCSVL